MVDIPDKTLFRLNDAVLVKVSALARSNALIAGEIGAVVDVHNGLYTVEFLGPHRTPDNPLLQFFFDHDLTKVVSSLHPVRD